MLYEIETGQRIGGESFGYQVHYYSDEWEFLGSDDPVYGFKSLDAAYKAGRRKMAEEKKNYPYLRQM